MNKEDYEKIIQAGKIASQVKQFAKSFIKKDMPLLEIAEKIEDKILKLGGKPAFPVNLSINNVAAHYTPSHDDKILAGGLLKVDFGVHIDGWAADNAFSLDLENNEENKKLISAAENALENALDLIKKEQDLRLNEIGKVISDTIESYGFSPVINLSGHSMENYDLHSGITVPNVDDGKEIKLTPGLYAIEPFATTGSGKVHEGRPSGIYNLISEKNVRSVIARKTLELIKKEYKSLPFCSRWLIKKMGTARVLFGLRELESNGNLHQFPQLVEAQGSIVSQAEETILIYENKVTVTTI